MAATISHLHKRPSKRCVMRIRNRVAPFARTLRLRLTDQSG